MLFLLAYMEKIMKKSSFWLIAFTCLLMSQVSDAQTTKKQSTPRQQAGSRLNALEQVLDLSSGTSAMLIDYKDDGGLNKVSSWYGINVTSFELQRGADGFPEFISIVPDPYTTTIKQIRGVLNQVCVVNEEDWNREDLQGRLTGKGQGKRCRGEFNNWFLGQGVLQITIYKNK